MNNAVTDNFIINDIVDFGDNAFQAKFAYSINGIDYEGQLYIPEDKVLAIEQITRYVNDQKAALDTTVTTNTPSPAIFDLIGTEVTL